MKPVAQLVIEMAANMARLQKDMDAAKRMVGSAMNDIKNKADMAMRALGLLGTGLSTAAFAGFIKSAIDLNAALNDLNKSTNITVNNLSGLNLAAKQSGSDLAGTAAAINKLQMNIGKNADQYKLIGVTAQDGLEAFKQLSDVFVQIEDPQLRAAFAAEALGKSWQAAAPLLSAGSEEIQKMIDRGDELAKTTPGIVAASEDFNNKLAELSTSFTGIANQLIDKILPRLTDLLELFIQIVEESTFVQKAISGINIVFETIAVLGANVGFVIKTMWNELVMLGDIAVAIAKLDFQNVGEIWNNSKVAAQQSRAALDAWTESFMKGQTATERATEKGDGFDKVLKMVNQSLTKGVKAFIDYSEKGTKVKDLYAEMIKKADELVASLQFETKTLEMDNQERETAIQLRKLETIGIQEGTAEYEKYAQAIMDTVAINESIKRRIELEKEAQKERIKQEEDYAKQVEKINDQIGQSLTDALMNGGMNAKEFLINMFKTMVLRPVLQPIITGFVGATGAGAALAGGMDQAGGMGGVGSFFGVGNAIKSAYSMVSSGFSTIGASVSESLLRAGDFLATSSSDFLAAGGEFLQSISQSAGTFATAAAGISAGFAVGNLISGDKSVIGGNPMFTTGGGAALGAAIGSIVPGIGTAIGGAIGGIVGGIVNAAFGSGKKEYTDSGIRGQLNAMGADLQEYQKWKKSGGWFSSTKRGTEFNDISAELKAGLDQTLGNISLSVALFAASLNQPVDAITSFSKQIDVSFKDLSEQEITAAIEGELKAFESGLIEAVIPTIRQFSMANEEVGATLQRLSNSMAVFNQTIDMLGFKMFDVSLIAADMASSVINMFGGQENFVAATSAYYDKFYTAQEKINYQTEQLTSVFDALNLALPDTHQQFRALVDAAQMAGDYKTFSTLVQLAPAFDALQTAMAELGNTAIRTATDIANEREKLETQLMQAIGNTAGLRQRELDALDPSNRALQQQIWAIEDARKAIDDAMATLSKSVEAERKQALERLQTENKAVMESLEAQKNASQIAADVSRNSVKTLQSFFDYIGSQVEQINREVGASRIAASGMEFISRALETAQRTGYLPNQNELASAITAARSGLGSENFSTSFEMRRANLQVAGQLTLLGEITGEQLTTAEKQLAAQEKMIKGINLQIQQAQEFYQAEVERTNTYYDKILEDVKAQIDALNGINTSVISVKDAVKVVETAISGLASAMMSAQSAQAAPMAGASSGAISSPQSGYRLVGNTLYFPGGGTHTVSGANGAQTLIQTYGLTQTSSGLVRTRAMGGYTPPGMTLVGEEGPELVNFRSPAMVYTNSELRNAMGGGDMAAEIRQLRQENQAQSRAMVALQARMTRIIERWEGDGLPTERYEGATA